MIVFALVPAVVIVYSLVRHHQHHDLWFGFRCGLLVACTFTGYAWARSIRFESSHMDGTAEFWAERERLIRPRFFYGCLAALAISIPAALIAFRLGGPAVAGSLIAIAAFAGASMLLMWGKVP